MRKFVSMLAAATFAVTALTGAAYAKKPMVGGAAMYANKNIVEDGPPYIRRYNHIAGIGRYMFRSDRDIARPSAGASR